MGGRRIAVLWLPYILFAVILLLLLFNLLIYAALNKLFNFENKKETQLKISIIVAALNEEENIPRLITALQRQNYPKENYEVIIVDDNSTDNTVEITKGLTTATPNFHLIKADGKKIKGKRGALDIGIENAKNPFILITDADCIPKEEWISSFARKFAEGNDFVFGIAPYFPTSSVTNLIARFENLRAQIIMFAFARLGFPYSAAARSFGFSKTAFKKIGGYKGTTDTLSGDDDLLLREAVKNGLNIGMVVNPQAFVFSGTKQNMNEFARQKARHTSTSLYYSTKTRLLLGFWHLVNLISLFSVFLLPFGIVFALPFFIKIIIDAFIINNFQNDFGYKINPLLFVLLQIVYELNLIYFFIKSFKFSHRWE